MKQIKVKDLMIPLSDYAKVSEEATLYDAVVALEEAQRRFDQSHYKHRAILVYNKHDHIVGKLSQWDVIKSLEPKYDKIGDFRGISRFGLTPEFMRSMAKNYALWDSPMQNLCKKAAQIKVKDIMYTPTEGEYVEEEATLDQGIHQLIVGHHQSLLVTRGKDITGILRLTDVFMEVSNNIRDCKVGE